ANYLVDYTNNIAEADKIYAESFTKVVEKEIGVSQENHIDILNHIATLREMTDKYADATATLAKAKSVAEERFGRLDWQFAAELTNIARLQIKMGAYEDAETNINKAIELLESKENRGDDKKIHMVNAVETQAVLFGVKGLFDDAEDALDRSGKIIS